MYKYFYVLNEDGTINSLQKSKKAPIGGVQITKAEYERYIAIINGVPEREGYDAVIHLYPDFTYTVEYVEVEVIIVNEGGEE